MVIIAMFSKQFFSNSVSKMRKAAFFHADGYNMKRMMMMMMMMMMMIMIVIKLLK